MVSSTIRARRLRKRKGPIFASALGVVEVGEVISEMRRECDI